jgi:hypothetical protein
MTECFDCCDYFDCSWIDHDCHFGCADGHDSDWTDCDFDYCDFDCCDFDCCDYDCCDYDFDSGWSERTRRRGSERNCDCVPAARLDRPLHYIHDCPAAQVHEVPRRGVVDREDVCPPDAGRDLDVAVHEAVLSPIVHRDPDC